MMKNRVKKVFASVLAGALILGLCACSGSSNSTSGQKTESSGTAAGSQAQTEAGKTDGQKTFTVGICNYVDDASLNQIVDSVRAELAVIQQETGVTINIKYDNCNTNASDLQQIIANFQAEKVDLMIGIATPVAMAMQAATDGTQTPVVFAAVSDPVGAGLVSSLEAPGANITGSSDYLDTTAVMNLIFAQDPTADMIGLLYDKGQDSSASAIEAAKAYLDQKNIAYKEYNGTNVSEVDMAVDSMIIDGVDAVFTPTDNTIMTAELTIYEKLANAGIPHYTGADSFALNGAFVGYGVDYAELGKQTADLVKTILIDGKNPAEVPVLTFDNGTATINTDTCQALGFDLETVKKTFEPYCLSIETLTTAESFQ